MMRFVDLIKKKLVLLLISCISLRFGFKVLKVFHKLRMKTSKAQLLPATTIPREQQRSFDVMGPLIRGLPKSEPINSQLVMKHFVRIMYEIAESHWERDGLVCFWFANPKFVPLPLYQIIVLDYALVQELCAPSMQPYLKKSQTYTFLGDLIGKSLVVESGKSWHKQRLILDKGFLGGFRKKVPGLVQACCTRFTDSFKEKMETNSVCLDVTETMIKLVFDILGKALLSVDMNCINDVTSPDAILYRLSSGITENVKSWVRNPLFYAARFIPFSNRQYWQDVKDYEVYLRNLVHYRQGLFIRDPHRESKDLVDVLVRSSVIPTDYPLTGEDYRLSTTEVVDNIKLLIFAGHDTTAITLSWGIYLLAKHPDIATLLYKELKSGNSSETLLHCVIMEVLRLYPPGMFFKEPVVDIQLGKYTIPKGSEIMLNPFILQRNKKYYANPHAFQPQRWETYVKENKTLSLALLKASKKLPLFSFSLGQRNCAGKNFALIQMKEILKSLVLNFHLSLPSEMPTEFQEFPYMGITMIPKGCHVVFEKRNFCEESQRPFVSHVAS